MGHSDTNEEGGGVQDILHGHCDNKEKDAGEVATSATIQTKCSISVAMAVFLLPIPEAIEAICPMIVPLPVLVIVPVATPLK